MKLIYVAISAVATLMFPVRLLAWGCNGHQIVAYIAERELNPTALSNAVNLLNSSAITIHRNCTASPGTTPMSDSATWADDIRYVRKSTAPWHFIDVPLAHAGEDPSPWCNDSCVIKALNDQMQVLRSADLQNPDPATVEALRYVIHFVGDVHQPLHAVTDADRGGNCDPINFGTHTSRAKGSSYSPELHGIWDTEMVEELGENSGTDSVIGLAAILEKEITPTERAAWSSGTPTSWSIESTKLAVSTAYTGLTDSKKNPVSAATFAGSEVNNACVLSVEKNIAALGIQANDTYRAASEAVIDQRLKQAGVRLAFLLNSIWPETDAVAQHAKVHRAVAHP